MEVKEQPFLDDPFNYPEFSMLVKRQGLQHAFRWGMHRHRTAALVALAACSTKFSGAATPSAGYATSGAFAVLDEWRAFLTQGLALDLLARHFEGIGSALACMFAMALVATLVYPLHLLIAPPAVAATAAGAGGVEPETPIRRQRWTWQSSSPSYLIPVLSALAVGSTALPLWVLAVWGAGNLGWGLASGMSVGLMAACLSMKSTSFAQTWHCFDPLAAAGAPAEKNKPRESGDGCCLGRGVPLTFGEFMFFLVMAPTLVCEPELLRARARLTPRPARALSEFFHALLVYVALHAACSAFFAPILRIVAASLFFSLSSLFSEGGKETVEFDVHCCGGRGSLSSMSTSWVDCAAWAGAEGIHAAGGSGGWFFSLFPAGAGGGRSSGIAAAYFESRLCGWTGSAAFVGWPLVAAAWALALVVLSPMTHFLAFYGFWHCVCLGCAELWGYPDRNFYGPYWLLTEEPGTMFRMWSTPVHRWLHSCIYTPIVDSKGAAEREREHEHERRGRQRKEQQRWAWGRPLGLISAFVFSSMVHEAVTFVAMRRTCWPFNTFCLVLASLVIHGWDAMYPVRSVISDSEVSGITKVSNEDKKWPQENEAPPTSATSSPYAMASESDAKTLVAAAADDFCGSRAAESSGISEEVTFAAGEDNEDISCVVVAREQVLGEHVDTSENSVVGGGIGGADDRGGGGGATPAYKKKKAGSEWRGWGAVAFFMGSSLVMGSVVDFLAWQWWRYALLHEP